MMALIYLISACFVLNTLAGEIYTDEEEQAQKVFQFMDSVYDNDKVAGRERAFFFKDTDCNRDGDVSKDEAVCMGKNIDESVTFSFAAFLASADSDDDGFVSRTEYHAFFDSKDTNNSNRITFNEFLAAWKDASGKRK